MIILGFGGFCLFDCVFCKDILGSVFCQTSFRSHYMPVVEVASTNMKQS